MTAMDLLKERGLSVQQIKVVSIYIGNSFCQKSKC